MLVTLEGRNHFVEEFGPPLLRMFIIEKKLACEADFKREV